MSAGIAACIPSPLYAFFVWSLNDGAMMNNSKSKYIRLPCEFPSCKREQWLPGLCCKLTHVSKDDTQNGLQYQGVVVDQPSLSEDFWGTSTDYLPGLSQRSISSLSQSNLSFNSDIGFACTNSRGEFANHDKYLNIYSLCLWKQTRLQWLGAKTRAQSNQAEGTTIIKMPPMAAYLTQDSISDALSRWE
ncbi:hypothetical protein Cgig2_033644 [Carnegiea gigantea]|uniref:Uncharacterized protein n=1 Tax=Carnegiea gigantea TaxID=171969 RepID=A0A9Q1JL09_9CARY|nr:hypothetical protein Cgig2_033644 [Carnegiea gigantea]